MASTLKQIAKNPASVHITMDPVPRSISDSKRVLAALRKFGEVATFRNLKYDTSNNSPGHASYAVAIYDNPDSAANAIAHGSFTIPPLPLAKEKNSISAEGSNSSSSSSSANPREEIPDKTLRRPLRCTIQASYHNHQSALKRNPYHTTFEIDKDAYHYRDLTQSTRIPLKELADGLGRRKAYVPGSVKKGIHAENVRWGATSLWGLYEEGLRIEKEGRVEGGG